MSENRFALIIANSEYQDPDLRKLLTPRLDAKELEEVLKDPEIGAFEVKVLLNEHSYKVNEEIEIFFHNRNPDDLLLLYFAGHGIKDEEGKLYFAVVNTRRKILSATSIPSDFVNRIMLRSMSRKKILLLDCCNSGAFGRGMVPMGVSGTAVITASDAMQYSWEVHDLKDEGRRSIFTSAIIEGLKTGNADLNGDGHISYEELYEYTHDRVLDETPLQKPEQWVFRLQGDIIIAKNPLWKPKPDTITSKSEGVERHATLRIFVSYSRRDAGDFAEAIRDHLTSFNNTVFTDTNSINGGEIWSDVIEDNISNCNIFVVIITHGALISQHVDKEVLQAKRDKKRIIPCVHRYVGVAHSKWGLEKIQGITFNNEYNLARELMNIIEQFKKKDGNKLA